MTTTDVAVPDTAPDGVALRDSTLVQWAYEAKQAHQIALSLAQTSFVPASLRGKPHDITAAILAGQELGLQPMAALRSMDIIQGTPALRAHAMRGLVQSHGHEIELVESTDTRCVMRGRRRHALMSTGQWQQVEWTIERANQLGLTGKDQWKKQPRTMLLARATGEICRLIAADVLYAMPHAAEELDGDPIRVDANVGRVTAAEILGEPEQEAPADAPAADEPVVQIDGPALLTGPQSKKLHALLGKTGRGDREVGLVYISGILDREVTTTKDLTVDDAGRVIDALEAEQLGEEPAQ